MITDLLVSLGLNRIPLPLADCPNCRYSKLPSDGGHCYMFKDRPGERCGQFTKVTDTKPLSS
jgi:hypothetical protein